MQATIQHKNPIFLLGLVSLVLLWLAVTGFSERFVISLPALESGRSIPDMDGTSFWDLNEQSKQDILFLANLADGDLILKDHAESKHGSDAETARRCLTSKNKFLFFNPITNRYAVICFLDDVGKWGAVFIEKVGKNFHEVTAFVKEKLCRVDQVIRYLENRQFSRIDF